MELLPLIRRLWHRRLVLVAGLVVAVAIVVALGPPPPERSALAWTRVGLDTPKSQLVESAPPGADTLPWRASLMSHLLATDETEKELARLVGVPTDQVTVADPVLDVPKIQASVPKKAAEIAAISPAPYVLTVEVKNSALPVISLTAAAPDRAGAAKLVDAAVTVLKAQSRGPGSYTSAIHVKGIPMKYQPFIVDAIAGTRTKTIVTRPVPIKALGGAGFVLFCCFAYAALAPRRPGRPRPLSRRPAPAS